MSTEEVNLKGSKDNQNNNINNNINEELLQNRFVKDLLVKVDVLKNGLLKERQINADLSSKLKKSEEELNLKIRQLKEELVSKTSQIKILIKEKMDLEKKLKQQQQKKVVDFLMYLMH